MFHFRKFSLDHEKSSLKIGTDSVLLGALTPVDRVNSLLDIGCGCGVIAFCIALKMGLHHPSLHQQIVGIDIDAPSIIEARENLTLFPKKKCQQIDFFETSLQQYVHQTQNRFDLIVSNPPYFANALKPDDEKKWKSKHRDAHLSFSELIEGVVSLLNEHGIFYLILPVTENEEFEKLAAGKLYISSRLTIKPTPQKPANRVISSYSKNPNEEVFETELIIRNENFQFSEEYKKITADFYL
ncbi:MAG: methyltransferase domain-containing protein [Bacteroidales bacterium]